MGDVGERLQGEAGFTRSCAQLGVLAIAIAFPLTAALAQSVPPPRFEQPSRLGSSVESAPGAEDAVVAQLLDMARQEADGGRVDLAQRLLENLIARYPQAAAVAQARRDLFRLYAARPEIATRPVESAAPGPTAPAPVAASAGGGGGWRTSMFARPSRDEEFRSAIGDRVFFSVGSSEMGSRARNVLAAQAGWLMRNADLIAVVEGHADPAESISGAGDIALQRAEVVRGRLIADGVEVDRVRIVSFGATQPIATCEDGACAAQNRRTIVRVEPRAAATVGRETTDTTASPAGRR